MPKDLPCLRHISPELVWIEVVVENLEVDPKHHKAFFKHSAKLLKKVSQENGGVNIRFPRAGSKSNQVWLKGARKFVNTAKIAIIGHRNRPGVSGGGRVHYSSQASPYCHWCQRS